MKLKWQPHNLSYCPKKLDHYSFLPTDTAKSLRKGVKVGQATIYETILGSTRDIGPNDLLNSSELNSERPKGYLHSGTTGGSNLFKADGKNGFGVEAAPIANCSDGGQTCTHAGYLLFKDLITNDLCKYNADSSCAEGLVSVDRGHDDALLKPNGGEVWVAGSPETVTWQTEYISGGLVNLYILHDDTSGLEDTNTQTAGSIVNGKNWYKFATAPNTGTYSFDPAILKGSGNSYRILVISNSDNNKWDISNADFSLSNSPQ